MNLGEKYFVCIKRIDHRSDVGVALFVVKTENTCTPPQISFDPNATIC